MARIPGTADCRACHEGQPDPVLGFTAIQLSSDRDPGAPHAGPPHAEVHVEELVARGLPKGLPRALVATPPRIATGSADERAALGYLHANCGICHNRQRPGVGRGRPILPPMPWEMAGKLTDQDLKAVFAYLRTIPAVKNRVPQPISPAAPPAAAPAAPSASAK